MLVPIFCAGQEVYRMLTWYRPGLTAFIFQEIVSFTDCQPVSQSCEYPFCLYNEFYR